MHVSPTAVIANAAAMKRVLGLPENMSVLSSKIRCLNCVAVDVTANWRLVCFVSSRRFGMNRDVLQGKWKQMKGRVRERWGELTNDDVDRMTGASEQLVGKIQERYGIARDEAQREVDDWLRTAEEGEVVDR